MGIHSRKYATPPPPKKKIFYIRLKNNGTKIIEFLPNVTWFCAGSFEVEQVKNLVLPSTNAKFVAGSLSTQAQVSGQPSRKLTPP